MLTSYNINLREKPDGKSKSLGLLARSTKVTLWGKVGKWYRVVVDSTGQAGYVYASYIKVTSVVTP